MPQVFSRRAILVVKLALITGIVSLIVIWTFLVLRYELAASPALGRVGLPRAQPVPFSHKHHVSGLGIDCRYCHTTVERSASAGLPPTETCMTCHSQLWTNAPMLAPIRESLARRQPLAWSRVYQLPDYVYFNHSIHVNKGIGCSSCHGRIDQMPITWKAQSIRMEWCLDCHRHPERQLRPRERIFDMNWRAPADQVNLGKQLIDRYHIPVRRLTDCSTCHR